MKTPYARVRNIDKIQFLRDDPISFTDFVMNEKYQNSL